MKEYKLYKFTSIPKDACHQEGGAETFTFNVFAENLTSALAKFKRIPDLGYMYDETRDMLTITCLGIVY